MNKECSKYQDLIMQIFDHAINESDRELLDQHMISCPNCSALMADMTGIIHTLETAPQLEPPADMEKLVMSKIQSLHSYQEGSANDILKALYGSLSVLAVVLGCVVTLGIQDGILSLISQGADSLNSFLENAWNFQIVYNLLSDVFSQMISSIVSTIQYVYIIAGFAVIIAGFKKLVLSGPVFHKVKE